MNKSPILSVPMTLSNPQHTTSAIAIPMTWALVAAKSGRRNDMTYMSDDDNAKARLARDVKDARTANHPNVNDNGRDKCRGARAAVHQ